MAAKKKAQKAPKPLTERQAEKIYDRVSDANAAKIVETFGRKADFNWGWVADSTGDEGEIYCCSKVYGEKPKVVTSTAYAKDGYKKIVHVVEDFVVGNPGGVA